MAEDWLYQITLDQIGSLHALSLTKILDFRQMIPLSTSSNTGTTEIQVDIIAEDTNRKILVLSECKEWLTLQGASECAEQLFMKTYLLSKYPPAKAFGKDGFNFQSLKGYSFLQYISLGSYSGQGYDNAKCSANDDLIKRLDFYSRYLSYAQKGDMGLFLFRDKDSSPVSRKGVQKTWSDLH